MNKLTKIALTALAIGVAVKLVQIDENINGIYQTKEIIPTKIKIDGKKITVVKYVAGKINFIDTFKVK